ncbi:PHO88 family protein NDAI_0A05170 [Naumovozyma dairenensis CBS 421]|uniref:Uncharacterized protein n=1 Tax=Naumovozyma dairenensis (strain ATCC 10597 / BCRC 20456 / CBS 421 / NBRC 0211 / NRRL Y-12639) TaxID=1071378 RepID=G0W4D4_NAUDC|nr:hypothetical protein NDAI_0A05170 [Naumovozyma dairenensis CBS 421]CCD22672.1 hypothetical protein NDAI_0A05170 [Naumovozyma dairenensis CBS 421]
MNPQLTNIIIMLVMMQISRRLDMEDPTIIFYVRTFYCSSILISWIIYQLAKRSILAKNDLTTIKFVQPKNVMMAEEEKLQVTTIRDYDLKDVNGSIKSIYTGVAMMGFMHFYMGYTNPLFMQIISPVKGALESNEVKIHLFGKPATGDLKRPFKSGSLFGVPTGNNPKTDKKSVDEAERAGHGGIKYE